MLKIKFVKRRKPDINTVSSVNKINKEINLELCPTLSLKNFLNSFINISFERYR